MVSKEVGGRLRSGTHLLAGSSCLSTSQKSCMSSTCCRPAKQCLQLGTYHDAVMEGCQTAGTHEALTCVRYRHADDDPAKYKIYRQQQEDSSSRKLDQACHWEQEKPQRHLLMARDAVRITRARKRCIST